MYPVGPTSSAVRCSVSDPFFTTSVCVSEVASVSPCTVMLVPLCLAVELKCTPCVPTAFMAAWYWVWALGAGDAAAPAARNVPGEIPVSAATAARAPAVAAVRMGKWRRGRMTFTLLVIGPGGARMRLLGRSGAGDNPPTRGRASGIGVGSRGAERCPPLATRPSHGAYRPDGHGGLGGEGAHELAPLRVGHVFGGGGLPLRVYRVLLHRDVGAPGADVEDDVDRLAREGLRPIDRVDGIPVERPRVPEGERSLEQQLGGDVVRTDTY